MLVSCANQPSTQRTSRSATPSEHEAIASVLRAGFGEIRDKGLIELKTGELFLAGLDNIDHLDPALHLETDDNQITLIYADQTSSPVTMPAADDMQGWIVATTKIFERAQALSPIAEVADRDALYQFMFEGALAKIDNYSRYSGGRNARANRATRNGFIGIGIDYDIVPGGAIVRLVIADGPAARAGIQIDDMISSADNKSLVGMTRETARRYIAGPPDSVVKLLIFRTGEDRALLYPVRRSLIVPKTVEATATDGIAFIRVRSFNIRTSADVEAAITDAKAQFGGKLKGVVMDLRGDPGGLLDQAVDLSDLFLDGGTITTLSGRHPGAKQYYTARPGDIADGKPMVVLVDGKSASSSEIMAAALADNERAIIIGTNTLGKGSVQTLIRLPNDAEIALTWAEVVTPGGYRMHGLGVLPTICTSSYDGTLAGIMEHVYRREAPWRAQPEAWRTTERTTEATAQLRNLCPAQSRPDAPIDQALAIRVATDQALYVQASSASIAASR
ncbi:MAG: peptidase [Rhodospirillaceae bacterium]|nr:MAG: peptidase [Rhodospirillaceae bacterium]